MDNMSQLLADFLHKSAMLSILALAMHLLSGCQGTSDLEIGKYYLAEGDLMQGKMYVFRPVGTAEDAPADYWFHKMIDTDSGKYLQVQYFGRDSVCLQTGLERVSESGAFQKSLKIVEKNAQTGVRSETDVQIKSGAMFPFVVKDTNTMIVYEINYQIPGNTAQSISITRNRRYAGAGPEFRLGNKKYATITMKTAETVSNVGEGSATIKATGLEIYAEKLGRVYYAKSFGAGQISEAYELVEIRDCPRGEPCF
jgi:hypothetical protein